MRLTLRWDAVAQSAPDDARNIPTIPRASGSGPPRSWNAWAAPEVDRGAETELRHTHEDLADEYGYDSKPPSKGLGVSNALQAPYVGEAALRAYPPPRVDSIASSTGATAARSGSQRRN